MKSHFYTFFALFFMILGSPAWAIWSAIGAILAKADSVLPPPPPPTVNHWESFESANDWSEPGFEVSQVYGRPRL